MQASYVKLFLGVFNCYFTFYSFSSKTYIFQPTDIYKIYNVVKRLETAALS